MPHALGPAYDYKLSSTLQDQLRGTYIADFICNTTFETDLKYNQTIERIRFPKITTTTDANKYGTLTKINFNPTKEQMTADLREVAAWEFHGLDHARLAAKPDSQFMTDLKEAKAAKIDQAVFSEYANALHVFNDGKMANATNGGGANNIIITPTVIYQMITALSREMTRDNMPTSNRWVIVDAYGKEALENSDILIKNTGNFGVDIITGGFMGTVGDIKVFFSNNLITAGGRKHWLGGQGKPVSLANPVNAKFEYVPSSSNADKFVDTTKFEHIYGVKTFTDGAERLYDIHVNP